MTLFAVPAVVAWTSSLDASAALPLVALPATLMCGLGMLARSRQRPAGLRIVGATLAAAALEAGAALALIAAYAAQHPEWDLS
ncbi:hypothetical protein [Nocardioides flavescens]|uniref:Uncharacterized protein n=1 Tax=Nocardioides flavescens TaxID=2691959 RepID=A0A6L7EZK1_9ACTN|nr:hypothetical protein [Nocardioides flavescens]MXG91208.1 hypothetical protein [Nocardioides flavescens]